jgi:hypothetical protein
MDTSKAVMYFRYMGDLGGGMQLLNSTTTDKKFFHDAYYVKRVYPDIEYGDVVAVSVEQFMYNRKIIDCLRVARLKAEK